MRPLVNNLARRLRAERFAAQPPALRVAPTDALA
jgi:hypothetical protein